MSVRRALAWSFFGQTFLFTIQFVGSVIVARLLSPYEIGIFAVAMATVGLIGTIQSFGLHNFIVREPEVNEDLLATAFTLNAILNTIVAVAIMGGSVITAMFLHEEAVGRVMSVIAISALFAIIEFRPRAMLQRNMQFRPLALIQATRALLTTSIVVFLAYRGFSYMSPAWGVLVGGLFSSTATAIVGRQHVRFAWRITGWRVLTAFGLRMAAIGGLGTLATRLSEIILARLLGLVALGLYTRAANIISLFWDNVYGVVTNVLFSRLSEEYRSRGSLREAYLRSLSILTAVMWPAFAGLAVLARPVIYHLYGPKWIEAANPLTVLAIAHLLLISMTMTWEIFVIRDETARQARFEFVKSGFGMAAFTIGSFFSITAAAGARIIEALFAFFLYTPHLNRMTSTTLGEFLTIYGRSALVSLAAVGPSLALMIVHDWAFDVPILHVAIAVVLGVACWLGLLALLRHDVMVEIRRVLSRLPVSALRATAP